jgi:hypothetical protein
MAHISSMTSGMFSYLDVYSGNVTAIDGDSVAADYAALFSGATVGTDLFRMPSVREFPAIGSAANVINVPVFGQRQSAQVAGQSDAPTMDVTINYVPADMTDIESLIDQEVAFRFMLAASEVTEAIGNAATIAVDNTEWYWIGKIAAVQVTPSLTDSNTAVVNITVSLDFVGAATVAAS